MEKGCEDKGCGYEKIKDKNKWVVGKKKKNVFNVKNGIQVENPPWMGESQSSSAETLLFLISLSLSLAVYIFLIYMFLCSNVSFTNVTFWVLMKMCRYIYIQIQAIICIFG